MSVAPHFSNEPGGKWTKPGRFVDVTAIEPMAVIAGLTFRPVAGETSLVNFVDYEPQSEAPLHRHAEEQIVLILDGQLEFTIDGRSRLMQPGDMAVIPPWVPHGAITREWTCRQIDIFTPARSTLIDHALAQVDRSAI